jgi:hypothetical protein
MSNINFKWNILELFANEEKLVSVKYMLSGTDGSVTVQSEGKHNFADGTVNKTLAEIVETDIVQWLEKDTTQDGINAIKLAIEDQIKALEIAKKVDFPWESGTFTIE